VALIDHDSLADPGGVKRAVAHVPSAGGTAIYRGWMLRADQYAAPVSALEAKGVTPPPKTRTPAGAATPQRRVPHFPIRTREIDGLDQPATAQARPPHAPRWSRAAASLSSLIRGRLWEVSRFPLRLGTPLLYDS
jgi:hypothetical protein